MKRPLFFRRWARFGVIAFVFYALGALMNAHAVDVVTTGGTTYKQARVIRVETGHVILTHAGGEARVQWSDLGPEAQLQLLKENLAELELIRGELGSSRKEAKSLKQTTEQYRESLRALGEDPATQSKPVPPAATLPPLAKTTVVSVEELVGHYRADAQTADARYRKKTFRLEAVVDRLEKDLFLRTYQALVKVPGKTLRVVCVIKPPEAYTKVYTTRNGERIVAEGERLGKVTLMQTGDKVVLEGRCTGLKDSTITFDVVTVLP